MACAIALLALYVACRAWWKADMAQVESVKAHERAILADKAANKALEQ